MAYLVLALGALLSICGAFSIIYGYGYILVERGWTSVIAGSTALSGGIVTIALGLVLQTLLTMRGGLVANGHLAEAQAVPEAPGLTPNLGVAPSHGPDLEAESKTSEAFDTREGTTLAPPFVEKPASLMTPELESGMLAAILVSHEADAPGGHEPVSHPSVTALRDAQHHETEPEGALPIPRDLDLDLPPPHAESSPALPEAPPEKSRFKVSFRRQPVAPEPTPDPVPEQAAVESTPVPAMDEWLDRAFSQLDSELPPARTHEEQSPPTAPLDHGPLDPVSSHHDHPDPHPQGDGFDLHPIEAPPPEHELAHAEPAPASFQAAEAPHDPVPPPTAPEHHPVPASAVIGRYEADGTSYIMYADGSIEAQSDAGVYRFNSMAELKAFIESAD